MEGYYTLFKNSVSLEYIYFMSGITNKQREEKITRTGNEIACPIMPHSLFKPVTPGKNKCIGRKTNSNVYFLPYFFLSRRATQYQPEITKIKASAGA